MKGTAIAWLATSLCALGCSEGDSQPGTPDAGTEPPVCGPGETAGPRGCCPAGSAATDDGICVAAGIPAASCGDGFEATGEGSCAPILPAEPCAAGLLAVPGDAACRELMACGTERYGAIPTEPDTQHVDGSYPDSDSDGSADRPWTTIQAGVDAAASGALVVVAAGSYVENVSIAGKAVRLWGRCPTMVEVVGAQPALAAVVVEVGAEGTVVGGLALTGSIRGVAAWGAREVTCEQLWVHDTGSYGVLAADAAGEPAELTVTGSLIEGANGLGVLARGGELVLADSVVRGTEPLAGGFPGRGIDVQPNEYSGAPAALVLRDSVVESNRETGLFVGGAPTTVEGSVVRDTRSDEAGMYGRGVSVQGYPLLELRSTVTVRQTVIEGNREHGMIVASSDGTVEHAVISHTTPDGLGRSGWGLLIQQDLLWPERSDVSVRASVVEHNTEAGIAVFGSDVAIDAVLVRHNRANAEGRFGTGILLQDEVEIAVGSAGSVEHSVVDDNAETGIMVMNSEATLRATLIQGTRAGPLDGLFGDGIAVIGGQGAPTSAAMTDCHIADNVRVGIGSFGGLATLEHANLSCNA
ncbi:MAG: right-handed parallel beta-helix repeat-containing protein, partial [Deltaproteobacteria bacterium]|nr:right-handed parallel beta-helix repeat-containing protein [Deltaproteobacteria bacterium]MBW2531748.1 right-handed parallel beta-helix repeat-containing protein [Deltaproteobacteria bacterium]